MEDTGAHCPVDGVGVVLPVVRILLISVLVGVCACLKTLLLRYHALVVKL